MKTKLTEMNMTILQQHTTCSHNQHENNMWMDAYRFCLLEDCLDLESSLNRLSSSSSTWYLGLRFIEFPVMKYILSTLWDTICNEYIALAIISTKERFNEIMKSKFKMKTSTWYLWLFLQLDKKKLLIYSNKTIILDAQKNIESYLRVAF